MHFMMFKEFMFVALDRETANTMGLKTQFYEFMLYLSLGLAISVFMKVAGLIFVFAVLLIPAMIGISLNEKTIFIFVFSILYGVLACFEGIYVSY